MKIYTISLYTGGFMNLIRFRNLLLFLVISSCWASWGASMDCRSGKSLTGSEEFVCANPSISKLDDDMVQAYFNSKSKLSAKNQELFQQSQRAWLEYWPKVCSEDGKGNSLESLQTQNGVSCAEQEYRERVRVLQLKKMTDDFVMFYSSTYKTLAPAKKGIPDSVNLTYHKVIYPQIETQKLKGEVLSKANIFNQWVSTTMTEFGKTNNTNFNENDANSVLVLFLDASTTDLISFVANFSFDGFTSNPKQIVERHHFVVSKSRPLRDFDLFDNPEWLRMSMPALFQSLRAQLAGKFSLKSSEELGGLVKNPTHWEFTKEGILFHFSPGEVAPASLGYPKALIRWKGLKGYIGSSGKKFVREITQAEY